MVKIIPKFDEEYREKAMSIHNGDKSGALKYGMNYCRPLSIDRCFGQGGKNAQRTGSIQEIGMRGSHHSLAFSTTGQRPFQPSRLQRHQSATAWSQQQKVKGHTVTSASVWASSDPSNTRESVKTCVASLINFASAAPFAFNTWTRRSRCKASVGDIL